MLLITQRKEREKGNLSHLENFETVCPSEILLGDLRSDVQNSLSA